MDAGSEVMARVNVPPVAAAGAVGAEFGAVDWGVAAGTHAANTLASTTKAIIRDKPDFTRYSFDST
jgi:hypothetical protein